MIAMNKHLLAASRLALALALLAAPAYAAIGDQSMDPAANNGSDQSDDAAAPKVQAPPSPTPSSKTAAPAAEATTDVKSLSPTDALFDAVNRGDLAAARDAVVRGADLNAFNSLGQTPIDASIDLGRNDITFELLAQRPLVSTSLAADAAPSPKRPVQQASVTKPAPNPGKPKPAVGFLGF
jgi:hypothetical protein